MINHLFAACLMIAAQTYSVPPQVLVGILHVEGGRIGQQVANKNGTYDLGPMQINTLWVPELAKNWKVPQKTAFRWLRDDGCTNVNVSAWILRRHLDETGSLSKAVAHYHSRTPSRGSRYKAKVVDAMRKKGLLTKQGAVPPPRQMGAQPAQRATGQTGQAAKTRTPGTKPPAERVRVGRNDQAEDKG